MFFIDRLQSAVESEIVTFALLCRSSLTGGPHNRVQYKDAPGSERVVLFSDPTAMLVFVRIVVRGRIPFASKQRRLSIYRAPLDVYRIHKIMRQVRRSPVSTPD
jgi:hypothetical protein